MVAVLIMNIVTHNKDTIMVAIIFIRTTIMVAIFIMRTATHNKDCDYNRNLYYKDCYS